MARGYTISLAAVMLSVVMCSTAAPTVGADLERVRAGICFRLFKGRRSAKPVQFERRYSTVYQQCTCVSFLRARCTQKLDSGSDGTASYDQCSKQVTESTACSLGVLNQEPYCDCTTEADGHARGPVAAEPAAESPPEPAETEPQPTTRLPTSEASEADITTAAYPKLNDSELSPAAICTRLFSSRDYSRTFIRTFTSSRAECQCRDYLHASCDEPRGYATVRPGSASAVLDAEKRPQSAAAAAASQAAAIYAIQLMCYQRLTAGQICQLELDGERTSCDCARNIQEQDVAARPTELPPSIDASVPASGEHEVEPGSEQFQTTQEPELAQQSTSEPTAKNPELSHPVIQDTAIPGRPEISAPVTEEPATPGSGMYEPTQEPSTQGPGVSEAVTQEAEVSVSGTEESGVPAPMAAGVNGTQVDSEMTEATEPETPAATGTPEAQLCAHYDVFTRTTIDGTTECQCVDKKNAVCAPLRDRVEQSTAGSVTAPTPLDSAELAYLQQLSEWHARTSVYSYCTDERRRRRHVCLFTTEPAPRCDCAAISAN